MTDINMKTFKEGETVVISKVSKQDEANGYKVGRELIIDYIVYSETEVYLQGMDIPIDINNISKIETIEEKGITNMETYTHIEASEEEEVSDAVNKPNHYASGKYEVIDYIEDKLSSEQYEGYCMGNVIKYVSRYQLKNGTEDLEKAKVYLSWAIEERESRNA